MWKNIKNRIKEALGKTSERVQRGWSSLFQAHSLKDVDWDSLEDTLLSADVGIAMTEKILTNVREYKGEMHDIRDYLIQYTANLLTPFERPLAAAPVVLFMGVNGSGKTTTIGKLSALWGQQGHPIHIIAGDTFRAGATEQLSIWTKDFPITTGNGDPASVVYQGLMHAHNHQNSVVLIDTAGRLPHQVGLMDQIKKIYRVVQKLRPQEHCEVILTLDANVGQHALIQIEKFNQCVPITGIIMTKMDGTAKGGILLNIVQRYALPIYGIGVGECVQDWHPFSAQDYARALWSEPLNTH